MLHTLELSVTTQLHHDQHLPEQRGSSAGASSTRQVTPGLHPGASSTAGPQQDLLQSFDHSGDAAVTHGGTHCCWIRVFSSQ